MRKAVLIAGDSSYRFTTGQADSTRETQQGRIDLQQEPLIRCIHQRKSSVKFREETSMVRGMPFGSMVAALLLALVMGGVPRAQAGEMHDSDQPTKRQLHLTGAQLLSAHGGSQDSAHEDGTISLAGLINFDPEEGVVSSVKATLVYQDSNSPADGITCHFSSPTALSEDCGLGTLSLSFVSGNECVQTISGTPVPQDPGVAITFDLYCGGENHATIIETKVDLDDALGDEVSDGTVVGSIERADE